VKEKYFAAKYVPAGVLLKNNAMTYSKFKLQLQFRNNKNYSSLTVNFMQVLTINIFT